MITDIIFSINVHEKKDFLIKQIKNINDYVSLDYIIVINANEYMFNEISNCQFIQSKDNIILNKNYLEKKRYHGSLTEGIYHNMKYAINNYNFKYFIILSSRNMFYNNLTCENYNSLVKISEGKTYEQMNTNTWHWHSFLKTKLSKYIIENKLLFSEVGKQGDVSHAHEGLTFNYVSCKDIINFLDNNNDIKINLFNWKHCVEEFALQTICINTTGYYYQIGNGTHYHKNIKNLPKNNFIYKTKID